MNLLFFDIKRNFKYSIIWTISILLFLLIILAFYPMIKEDMQLFIDVMKNYPTALKKAFGMNFERVNNVIGYFASMPYNFLVMLSSLEAILLGISIISIENISKTSDFIFTKPISRLSIFISKITASFSLLMFTNIFIFIIIYSTLSYFDNVNFITYFLLYLTIILLQILFLMLGVMIATVLKKIKSPVTLAMAITFGLYAVSSIADEKMRLLIPFQYFNPNYIIENNSYENKYLIIIFLLIAIFTLIAKIIYIKKDIHSV